MHSAVCTCDVCLMAAPVHTAEQLVVRSLTGPAPVDASSHLSWHQGFGHPRSCCCSHLFAFNSLPHTTDAAAAAAVRLCSSAVPQVPPQNANRMVDAARGVLNQLLADVYIFTDAAAGPAAGNSPGYGITLVAETTSGCLISAEAAATTVRWQLKCFRAAVRCGVCCLLAELLELICGVA